MTDAKPRKGAFNKVKRDSANNAEIVGRAELKLAEAVQTFGYDFRGKTVLDIGSSTGGFTEYALNRGAKKVIAVEKGTNQMKAPLRFDSRIDLREKTDIFDVTNLTTPDVILADVSFVSLKKVLEHASKNFVAMDPDFLVMLKPQFEAYKDQLVKGVVKNEKIRRQILQNFEQWLKMHNFRIIKKRDNQIIGRHGNQERFYWLKSISQTTVKTTQSTLKSIKRNTK